MSRFEPIWDSFWTDLHESPGASPWDVDPNYVAHAHLDLFGSVLDPSLPVIDVGCGDGAQTAALARHFDRVIGVDVMADAVPSWDRTAMMFHVSNRTRSAVKRGDDAAPVPGMGGTDARRVR
ncbi:hypothetical protein AQ490_05800 [Wenjunlia vitaminophila]|uniref:Methyltransferase type 11 domain-containing protein n=1 Tax=Wenjunlia vitaminophila TaxID=76728 RepID=A0A0T6LP46_WENVI|nr:class I SAM-dependent methyltransferase [Wenjunlia vitaminophila]KRV47872.1 hypothetical protein AQ490_05800 [Wenjunlia vitaminophila]